MKIKKIEAKIVSIPLDKPKVIATGPIISREYLITKITTDNGIVGWGMTFVSGNSAKEIIEKKLQHLLLDKDPNYVENLWEKMFYSTLKWGRRGIYIRAISAIDIALWDIKCKAFNVSLSKLLGGYREAIPVYASGGYCNLKEGVNEVDAIAKEMQEHVRQGFSAAKMKMSGVDLNLDIERIKAAREVLGEKRKLYIDANNGWKLYQLTPRIIDELEEIGIDWLEEPFMPDAIEETARLREKTTIPIATGELLSTRWDFKQLLDSNSFDIWQPDVAVLGGITEWIKVMAMALIWNIPVAPHALHEIHLQLAAACPESQVYVIEYLDTTGDVFNYGKLLKKPLKAKKGYLHVPEDPGVGIEFDEALIDQYEVK
jgi:L-alanine-DL-glutamate epimerase-like enolase superfamily enzyme